MARYESEAIKVVRRNPFLLAIASACVTSVVALWASHGFATGAGAVLLGTALYAWIWLRNPWQDERFVHFAADHRGLYCEGELTLPRDDVANAYMQPDEAGPLVKLTRHDGRELTLRMPSDDDARKLLAALALDVRRAVAVFRARPVRRGATGPASDPGQAIAITLVVMLYLVCVRFRIGTAVAFVGPLVFFALQRAVSGQIHVGSDGFVVEWLGTRRFVPFAEVHEIGLTVRAVSITLHSGELLDLHTPMRHYADAADRDALKIALDAGFAAATAHDSASDAEALVARGNRSAREWLRSVHAITAESPAGYRGTALPAERLLAIVEDPRAEPSARLGAAVALRTSLDDEGRIRVRVAAEASTSPLVRVALEPAFSEATDAELARLVDDVDASLAPPENR